MAKNTILAVLTLALCIGSTLPAYSEIQIGVLALRGIDEADKSWSPLGKYLTSKMGQQVKFIPTAFVEMMFFCRDHPEAFIIANPSFFIKAKVKYHAEPVLTLNMKKGGDSFGGVIISKKGSGIEKLNDIKQKNLICAKFSSAGGWHYQKAVMLENGIHPEKDCKTLTEAVTHDGVVFAIYDGKADVGTLRTGILENMAGAAKINLSDFVIIHPMKHPGFNLVCSTPLYPEWPLAKLSKTPPNTVAALKAELKAIPAGHYSLATNRVETFIDPLDYTPVENMMKLLKIDPFRR